MKHESFNKILALLLTLALVAGSMPGVYAVPISPASDFDVVVDLSSTQSGTGFTFYNNRFSVTAPADHTVLITGNGNNRSVAVYNAINIAVADGTRIVAPTGHHALTVPTGAIVTGLGDNRLLA